MRADLARHGIDAAWQEPGMLSVATRPHELPDLGEEAALLRRYGWEAEVRDRDATRAEVASPTYHFGSRVDDARLGRRPATLRLPARQLVEAFPALEGVAITHAWGSPIDTCSRFCVTFGRAFGGRARSRSRPSPPAGP